MASAARAARASISGALPGSWPTSADPAPTPTAPSTSSYITAQLHARRHTYLTPTRTTIKTATWNIGNCPCLPSDLSAFLLTPSEPPADIYILALQEVLDINQTQSVVWATDPKHSLQWKRWVSDALPPGYRCVASPQLVGVLLLVYTAPNIEVGSVQTATVGTGLLGYAGNKGAVGVRMVLNSTLRLVVVDSHLAAFANGVERRNWDYGEVVRRMRFAGAEKEAVRLWEEEEEGGGVMDADVVVWAGDLNYRIDLENRAVRGLLEPYRAKEPAQEVVEGKVGLSDGQGEEGEEEEEDIGERMTFEGTLESLIRHDQLRKQRRLGKAFKGFKEGKITFLPTYKYDVGTVGTWDSSEKARAPSWCDRILWRVKGVDDEPDKEEKTMTPEEEESKLAEYQIGELVFEHKSDDEDEDDLVVSRADSPDRPPPTAGALSRSNTSMTISNNRVSMDLTPLYDDPVTVTTTPVGDITLEQVSYTSHQTVTSSDHKPVTSLFTLTYPGVDASLRHQVHAEIAREADKLENERRPVITFLIESTDAPAFETPTDDSADDTNLIRFGDVHFWEEKHRTITVANTGTCPAHLHFMTRPDPDEPAREILCNPWMSVAFSDKSDPAKGITLQPGETTEIALTLSVATREHVAALNADGKKLDDILILRITDGRDHFLPIAGTWHPSSFGTPLEDLVRIPETANGYRGFHESRQPLAPGTLYSAPRELYRLTSFLLSSLEKTVRNLGPDDDITTKRWYATPGWPFVSPVSHRQKQADIWNTLDTDAPLPPTEDEEEIEAAAAVLLQFLRSLPESVIPESCWETVVQQGGEKERDNVLDKVPSVHANVFISLVGFMGEVVRVLGEKRPVAERGVVIERVVEVLAPVIVRRPERVGGRKAGAEGRRREWVRRWLEM